MLVSRPPRASSQSIATAVFERGVRVSVEKIGAARVDRYRNRSVVRARERDTGRGGRAEDEEAQAVPGSLQSPCLKSHTVAGTLSCDGELTGAL